MTPVGAAIVTLAMALIEALMKTTVRGSTYRETVIFRLQPAIRSAAVWMSSRLEFSIPLARCSVA